MPVRQLHLHTGMREWLSIERLPDPPVSSQPHLGGGWVGGNRGAPPQTCTKQVDVSETGIR